MLLYAGTLSPLSAQHDQVVPAVSVPSNVEGSETSTGPWGLLELRAAFGEGVGTGHVRRLLALGDAWRSGAGTAIIRPAAPLPSELRDAADQSGVAVDESETTPVWSVLDSYTAPLSRDVAAPLMIVDDLRQRVAHGSELVLDQNVGATRGLYPEAGDVLLGPGFCLLRPEFANAREGREQHDQVRTVVVALGGAPDASLLEAVSSIVRSTLPNADVDVIDGRRRDVGAAFAEASVAVSAAGTTTWELLCVGVPTILLSVAANQERVRDHLVDARVCWRATVDDLAAVLRDVAARPDDRERRAARGRGLVDGLGAPRVVADLRSRLMQLRPATANDARLLWDWANDPVTRDNSFSSAPIPWHEHQAWLDARLADRRSLVLVASLAGEDVGQVRFHREEERAEISVVVAPDARGRGFGSALIRAGVRRAREEWGPVVVGARIKATNRASVRAFRVAGFQPATLATAEHGEISMEDRA